MSYYEAKEDHVRIGNNGTSTIYYPPCRICGREVKSLTYLRNRKYLCPECKVKLKKKIQHLGKFYQFALDDGTTNGTLEEWATEKLKEEIKYATSEKDEASGFLLGRKEES